MESDKKSISVNPDKVIHERARLLIMTFIASSDKEHLSFNELQNGIGLTSGNLSVQLRKLEEAGYVSIIKEFRDKKPLTSVVLTIKGSQALRDYINEMDAIIKTLHKVSCSSDVPQKPIVQ